MRGDDSWRESSCLFFFFQDQAVFVRELGWILPQFAQESCINRCSPREEECKNSDVLSTMTRQCTLYILAQSLSVPSFDQM